MNDCLKPELSVHLYVCYFVVQRLLLDAVSGSYLMFMMWLPYGVINYNNNN